ncbi:MAG: nicotinate-nucleotide--dimethylbenzimidazole phosphoribosyltransferase [Planctomycetota bacterium]
MDRHLNQLTKPRGSLGRLEKLAARLCQIQQTLKPETTPRRLVLFAGDHGVAASGVTAWPSAVTGLMIQNIRNGGAGSSVLAARTRTEAVLVDVGSISGETAERFESGDGLSKPDPRFSVVFRNRRLRAGTRDLSHESALTGAEFEQALEIGRQEARTAAADGIQIVATGEMGIGNTTPSACLSMLLANVELQNAVGRGAGADEITLERKRQVVQEAVERARKLWKVDSLTALASVAGLEIAAIAGFFLEARSAGLTIILDGYVTTAAALIARHIRPGIEESLIASHLSAEPGHRMVLEHLGLTPFLEWDLRLGEGTGALLLMPLLDAAAAVVGRMATFADLGIQSTG